MSNSSETIACPGCGRTYPFRAELLGKLVQCRSCGQAFRIAPAIAAPPSPPSLSSPSPPPPPKPQATVEPLPPMPDPMAALQAIAPAPPPTPPVSFAPIKPAEYAVHGPASLPDPSTSDSPFSPMRPRPKLRVGFDVQGALRGFLATHKLLLAVLVAASVIILWCFSFRHPGAYLIAFPFIAPLALLIIFGLRPPPPRGESVAGVVFLIINILVTGLQLLFARGQVATALSSGPGIIAAVVVVVIWLMYTGVMYFLLTEFGFFRVYGWVYLIQCGVFIVAVMPWMHSAGSQRRPGQSPIASSPLAKLARNTANTPARPANLLLRPHWSNRCRLRP